MQIIGHRGARGLAPENTVLGIKVALREKVDMIELDLRLKDDAVVLSHDPIVENKKYATLHAALKTVHGKVPLNLEIKAQKHVEPYDIIETLKKETNSYRGKIIISSYSYPILKAAKELIPHADIAILEKWSGVRAVTKATMLETTRIHINEKALWSGFMKSMKHRGYSVYAYSVNLRDRAEELEEWGVDGVFTDYPNLFRES